MTGAIGQIRVGTAARGVARFLNRKGQRTRDADGTEVTHTKRERRAKVVVVNGNPDVLELLESALDGGRYDLLFADAGRARLLADQARAAEPGRALSVHIDAADGFQLLSMLKLDPATQPHPGRHLHQRREQRRRAATNAESTTTDAGTAVDAALRRRQRARSDGGWTLTMYGRTWPTAGVTTNASRSSASCPAMRPFSRRSSSRS